MEFLSTFIACLHYSKNIPQNQFNKYHLIRIIVDGNKIIYEKPWRLFQIAFDANVHGFYFPVKQSRSNRSFMTYPINLRDDFFR